MDGEQLKYKVCHRGLSPGSGVDVLWFARSTTTPISVQWVQSAGCKHKS